MGFRDLFKRSAPAQSAAPQAPARHRVFSLNRMARALESHFSGADTDRLTSSWGAHPMPADEIVRRHQRVLVARARQQATENGYARSFLRLCRTNIVGSGVTVQPSVKTSSGALDKATNDAIEAEWKRWGRPENCDVAGRRSWHASERIAVQCAARDGEFFYRTIYGAAAGPYGFSLQWIDPQRCPVDFDVAATRTGGNFIRHGIEFNDYGRAVAYFFTTTSAGEADYRMGGRDYVRVPAEEIIHGFVDDLGGQKRGLPWMATGLGRLRHVAGTEDAAAINARVGAAKMGVIQFAPGTGPESDDDDDFEIDAEPGTFPVLPEGATLNKWDPQYPAGEFPGFMKHMLRGTAAGWGVLYNNLVGDLENVNFSSIRQGTLDERERWKEDQLWLIGDLHAKVYAKWLDYALLAGKIRIRGQALSAARAGDFEAVSFQGRRWTWIDPSADVKAAVDSKNNLLMSPGQIIREAGGDPSTRYAEIAQDIKDMQAAGIPEEFIKLAFGQKIDPKPTEKPANAKAE